MLPREPTKRYGKDKKVSSAHEIYKEHEDLFKEYKVKYKDGQDITLIETRDPREVIEMERKETEKREKELAMDVEDTPINLTTDEIDAIFDDIEKREEIEKQENAALPQEPIGLTPMEEVVEGDTSEQKTIEIGQQPQEPAVQRYALELTFPVKRIVTTSNDKKKSKYDTGYTKIQFIFENDISVQIIFETYYSFNEKKGTIYENAKYQVRIHKDDMNRYINLENDTKWAKLHQDYESKMRSNNKTNLISYVTHYLMMQGTIKPTRVFLNATVKSTSKKKIVYTPYQKRKLISDYRDEQRKAEGLSKRGPDLIKIIFRGKAGDSLRYRSSEEELFEYLMICTDNMKRENGEPYVTIAQFIEDYIQISAPENASAEELAEYLSKKSENFIAAMNFIASLINDSEKLTPLQKIDAMNLWSEYLDETVNIEYYKRINEKIAYDDVEPLLRECDRNIRNMEGQILSTEESKDGNDADVSVLEIAIATTVDGKYINVLIDCDNSVQYGKLKEIFNKRLRAILITTKPFSTTQQEMANKKKEERDEYVKKQRALAEQQKQEE